MMRGDSDDWFKSANVATYKNFSYGYRLRDTGPGTYAELGGEFPQDIPPIWLACDASQSPDPAICPAPIETREFEFGDPWNGERAAIFKLFDLREFMAAQGQTGFFLVTARVRKFRVELWSTRIARGFWEVVPADKFEDVDELVEAVQAGNDPGAFSLFYGVINQDFRYRLVTSGEVVHLDQEFGALYSDPLLQTFDEGRVQGIIGVEDSNGANDSLANLFQRFMDDGVMNELPLIDVKAVDHDFDFQTHDDDSYVYYACAKDGWLFVNNVSDGSYLFVDTRRGSGFEDHPTLPSPYWQSGHFADRTVPIPAGCYDGWVCAFSVTVDSAFQVVEVSENNNLAEGACFAPTG